MKYWKISKNSNGYGDTAIVLKCGDRVLSVTHEKDGNIMFMEECDGYFSVNYTKEESIELINELLEYIKNEDKGK